MNNLSAGVGSIVNHQHFGRGIIVETGSDFFTIYFKSQAGVKRVDQHFTGLSIAESVEKQVEPTITLADVESALENILDRKLHEMELVPLGNKWNSGKLILKPGEDGLQEKELPIETFFS